MLIFMLAIMRISHSPRRWANIAQVRQHDAMEGSELPKPGRAYLAGTNAVLKDLKAFPQRFQKLPKLRAR
jgi:hypothetical protein